MFKSAYSYDEETFFYFDAIGNKYVARGGSLAWRINNPGLISSRSHFAGKNGSIGSYNGLAIFPNPQQGRKALSDWLHAKKYYNSTLKAIAYFYWPNDTETYFFKLVSLVNVPSHKKVCTLSQQEFRRLLIAIEKLSNYSLVGNENFVLLPKIYAHIKKDIPPHDFYMLADNSVHSKDAIIEKISTHQLDAIIIHSVDGSTYIRSRPSYTMWNIHMPESALPSYEREIGELGSPSENAIDTIMRVVGEKKDSQCIWGFINGIWNAEADALKSAHLISNAANGEEVFACPNDTLDLITDLEICGILKITIDMPILRQAVKFFQYLLFLSNQNNPNTPIIVFAHSMGAIISEHALELLEHHERQKIHIYTFGGGSFIAPGKSHPDSHNYASERDLVCWIGSPYLRWLLTRRFLASKEGLNEEQMVCRWAQEEAMLHIDSIDPDTIHNYEKQREKLWRRELSSINNITIVDSDACLEHSFCNECYQKYIRSTVARHREAFSLDSSKSMNYAMI